MTSRVRPLKILYIAYPLLPVSENSCGGAEQVLVTVEREMHRRGHQTMVAACAGSRVAGELLPTGSAPLGPDEFEQRNTEHNRRILSYLADHRSEFDLIHDHSGTFWQSLAHDLKLPVVVTLHLARSFYGRNAFDGVPRNVFFNCVSETQAQWFRGLEVTIVRNGVDPQKFPFTSAKDGYLLWLGRICAEKGAHLAIEVAQKTGLPLVLAGQVYPFSYHEEYFRREIFPHLDGERIRWEEVPGIEMKLDLLRRARALLLPSLVDETSSLVAMEAMACGTPVIALRRGAIPDVVADGRTGLVVETVPEMANAVNHIGEIYAHACRAYVEEHHSAQRMTDGYEALYRQIVLGAIAGRYASHGATAAGFPPT